MGAVHFTRPYQFSRKTTVRRCSDTLSAERLPIYSRAWSSHVEHGVAVKAMCSSAGVAHCVSPTAGTGGSIRET